MFSTSWGRNDPPDASSDGDPGDTGDPLSIVRRRLGTVKTVEMELEYGSKFNDSLAFGPTLILDQEDAQTRELRVRLWDD